MVKTVVYGLFKFLVEFTKLFPVMYYILGFKLQSRKKIIVYSSAAFMLCVISSLPGIMPVSVPVAAWICCIYTILILKGKGKVLYCIAAETAISLLDLLTASMFLLIDKDSTYESLVYDRTANIITNSVSIFFIAAVTIFFIIVFKSKTAVKFRINIIYLLLIILGEISVCVLIAAFLNTDGYSGSLGVILAFAGIAFLVLSIVAVINLVSKNHYKEIADINEKLLKSKENYYSMMIRKDRDTAKFRHDINNHLNCMYMLFDSGRYDELRDYFGKIGASLSELRPEVQTGNDMINAILNDTASKFPSVRFEINGKMPDEIILSAPDICTLFSNLFDNAFAAAEKSAGKTVAVSFKIIGLNLLCEIKNSVPHKIVIEDNRIATEKSDKSIHGFGTQNAADCAERNGGTLVFSCDDEYFTAEILIPIL